MSYVKKHRFSISGFAFACLITVAVHGSVLMGFDHLAQLHDTAHSNSAC
jgi:hypothetical protein